MVSQGLFLKNRMGKSVTFGLVVALIVLPLAKIYSLHSTFFDLGIFESVSHRVETITGWSMVFAAGHAHGFFPLFRWLSGLVPSGVEPFFYVGVQSILLALPVYWLFRRFGVFSAYAYAAYYLVWANALFDFHFDHLAVPLLLGFYIALQSKRIGWAVLSATLLMLVKEPFALETAACGLLLLIAAFHNKAIWEEPIDRIRKRNLILGALWLISVGMAYFVFATRYLIPYFCYGDSQGFHGGEAFGWLGNGLGEIIFTIISRPHFVIFDIIFTPGKLIYLGMIFGLLAFIPLLRPTLLVPTLPMLAIALLSHVPNHYDFNTHYTAGLIIPVIFAFIHGLPKAHALWMRGSGFICQKVLLLRVNQRLNSPPLVQEGIVVYGNTLGAVTVARLSKTFFILLALWILAGHMMLSFSPISRLFWSEKVWSYNWRAYVPTERDAMMKASMLEYIPADPDVSVSTQNTINWSYLSHRNVYLPFPWGVAEPQKIFDWSSRELPGLWQFMRTGDKPLAVAQERYAEYVVLDMKRPYFLVDKGCEWIYGECRDKAIERKFLDKAAYARAHYTTVFEQDGFMILRRRVE